MVLKSSRVEAKEVGDSLYFTGVPCIRGHLAPRYTSGSNCKECLADSGKERRKDPKVMAAARESALRYYYQNLESCREASRNRMRRLSESDPVSVSEKAMARHYKNLDRNTARNKQWRKDNPGALKEYSMRRKASAKQRIPDWADRAQINSIYSACKLLSLETGIEFQVDHIVPLHGKTVCGLHVHYNLRIITKSENMKKRNRLIEDIL